LLRLEQVTAIHQVLLDVAHAQLYLESIGVDLGDLVQAVEDGFEPGQVVHLLDLGVQALEFRQGIQVLRAHVVIVH
jgi:hypothetical protein